MDEAMMRFRHMLVDGSKRKREVAQTTFVGHVALNINKHNNKKPQTKMQVMMGHTEQCSSSTSVVAPGDASE
jgi:hypothetical protein